jgi:hypothetical protein
MAAGGVAGMAVGATALDACDSSPQSSVQHTTTSEPGRSTTSSTRLASRIQLDDLGLPIADWVVEENARKGTLEWLLHPPPPMGVEGYLDHVSAAPGDEVTLFVTSTASLVIPKVYRLGWYQGYGARFVADLGKHPGVVQPEPTFTAGVNMVECHWSPTLRFEVGHDWPSGYYLIHLGTSKGFSQWVPLVVRDDSSTSAVLVQSSVTTWQAYNLWGGYSLYLGPDGTGGTDVANRSRVVSFDRPYPPGWEDGTADLFGNEYPIVALLERLGVDVSYWTDIDLHHRAALLAQHRCLVSLGHDEYWSSTMRYSCEEAIGKGLNVAFLGANACYRHIRLDASPVGDNRRVVCYKDATEDPYLGKDNAEVTANWGEGPDPRPESSMIGVAYQAFQPYESSPESLVVVDPESWILEGTGLAHGAEIPFTNGSEFDRYSPGPSSPTNVHIVCHSPITSVLGPSYSDMAYYTVPGGGGVFSSGTASFVDRLWANPGVLPKPFAPGPIAGVTEPLTRITTNVLAEFSKGPAAASRPSGANWQEFYSDGSAALPPVDVP